MRIARVEISNYRSYGPEPFVWTVPDLKSPLSIIGSNNSGKTNLVAAILHALGSRSSHPSAFSSLDFHREETDNDIHVAVDVDPPLLSASAYNKVSEMPRLDLKVSDQGGGIEVAHYCCDSAGKVVFNPRAVKRGKGTEYSKEENAVLTSLQRSGAEQVYKWKSKIPVHYLGPETLWKELTPTRYSLLGGIVRELLEDFNRDDNTMQAEDGVPPKHVGRPRREVYESALGYLERHVLATPKYRSFVEEVEAVLMEQLEIASDGFALRLSPPDPGHFFRNLLFTVREESDQPLLPISHMGTGFQSLFVVALLRALVDSDQGDRIFIVEEPESFLHEHYQEYFYQVLCKLSHNNQVIITTHSKKFVDPFEPRSILRLSKAPGAPTAGVAPSSELTVPTEVNGKQLTKPTDFAKYLRTLEPNLGNVVFASKVIVVEGPHDLLAYSTLISSEIPLGLRNIAIVAAWGKDAVVAIVDLCNLLQIDCFVIHDSDLPEGIDPQKYTPPQKAQQTKNATIASMIPPSRLHKNVPNLEGVLAIPLAEKSAAAVFAKVSGVTLSDARKDLPALVPESLLEFLG